MKGIPNYYNEELLNGIKLEALENIISIVFDTAGVQPDDSGKLRMIEGVISFLMALEDNIEMPAEDATPGGQETKEMIT